MPDEILEIRGHLARHDQRFDELESRVEHEAGLRAMMDHDLATLNKKLDANTKLIQALRDTQKDHTRMLTRMETDVSGLKTDVSGLRIDVSGLKSDVSGLKTDVSRLKSDVSGLRIDVSGLKTDVSGLKTDVSGLKSDVSGLRIDVSGLKTDVSGLKTDVAELKVGQLVIVGKLDEILRKQ
jgi:chromosome segregation ATPase